LQSSLPFIDGRVRADELGSAPARAPGDRIPRPTPACSCRHPVALRPRPAGPHLHSSRLAEAWHAVYIPSCRGCLRRGRIALQGTGAVALHFTALSNATTGGFGRASAIHSCESPLPVSGARPSQLPAARGCIPSAIRQDRFQHVSRGEDWRIQNRPGRSLPAALRTGHGRGASPRSFRFYGECAGVAGIPCQGRAVSDRRLCSHREAW